MPTQRQIEISKIYWDARRELENSLSAALDVMRGAPEPKDLNWGHIGDVRHVLETFVPLTSFLPKAAK